MLVFLLLGILSACLEAFKLIAAALVREPVFVQQVIAALPTVLGVVVSLRLIIAYADSANAGGDKLFFDAEQVAFTLFRLVQMASQYHEHAASEYSDKFELELRLTEAEGVLRMHRSIFGKSAKSLRQTVDAKPVNMPAERRATSSPSPRSANR